MPVATVDSAAVLSATILSVAVFNTTMHNQGFGSALAFSKLVSHLTLRVELDSQVFTFFFAALQWTCRGILPCTLASQSNAWLRPFRT
ncbi:hypothetical protein VN12_02565 [Pirellula sp. SH-Sr6A]|nr:hypothetical protein VN12_02565 [Pirellula sp. SH-Sr6A]